MKKDYEQFTTRIDKELLDQVRKNVAENKNIKSINGYINDCIRYAIENLEIKE